MNKVDEKVKEYLDRAEKVLGIQFEGEKQFEKPIELFAFIRLHIETAKMIQLEEHTQEKEVEEE